MFLYPALACSGEGKHERQLFEIEQIGLIFFKWIGSKSNSR